MLSTLRSRIGARALSRTYTRVPLSAFKVPDFKSTVFEMEDLKLAGNTEKVLKGGRDLFSKLPAAFKGVKQIGVIGYSSQGPAQALNLHESLQAAGLTSTKVVVGLREGSKTAEQVKKDGLEVGEVYDVIKNSDMVLLLISDAAQTIEYQKVFDALKPGAFLGLSHGFLLGYLNNVGKAFPKNIDVALVAPKGAGPSVRRLYEQGKTVNGAGINCSFAIENDATGTCVDKTLGWAIAVGAPYAFPTTLSAEFCSDIFGERCVLLGGLHGMAEFLYRTYIRGGASKEEAYKRSAESLTGPISHTISKKGMLALYNGLSASDKVLFEQAYCASYHALQETIHECYEEVRTGREIGSVIDKCESFEKTPTGEKFPMGYIGGTEMWKVGQGVRAARTSTDPFARPIDPTTAGVYVACIVAQCDVLLENGHCYSEVANESIIEGVDSLNPFMDHNGVAFMVDSCSVTARLGSRKWAPRFDYLLEQNCEPLLTMPADPKRIEQFKSHKIHEILAKCSEYRPSVDIAFVG
jgi:ketol-acid reductoisomerase